MYKVFSAPVANLSKKERRELMNWRRRQFLARIKTSLQKAIDLCDEARDYFSNEFQEEFLDFDLKNSLECALEDVERAAPSETECPTNKNSGSATRRKLASYSGRLRTMTRATRRKTSRANVSRR